MYQTGVREMVALGNYRYALNIVVKNVSSAVINGGATRTGTSWIENKVRREHSWPESRVTSSAVINRGATRSWHRGASNSWYLHGTIRDV